MEYLDEIENTTKRTRILLENLLDWSASQTGKIEYAPANMNLNELVGSVVGLVESQAMKKKIEFVNNVKDTARAYADWHMIEVVLRNLLTNAIKFSKENSIVKVEAEHRQDSLVISIHDSGLGIDEETKKKLFDISKSSSQSGTQGEKGTGLGLTISQEFVEKNKGKIWVDSNLHEGSIFYFSLPHAVPRNREHHLTTR